MKILKNNKGFTLIEMMIVLFVISILMVITIPNVTKNNSNINEKGCEAYIQMVQGQVQAYQMKEKKIPTTEILVTEGYITSEKCPTGKTIEISTTDGTVTAN